MKTSIDLNTLSRMRAWSAWWILIIFVILEIQKSTPAKLEKFRDDKMDLEKISKREKVNGVLESTDTDKVNKGQDEKENVFETAKNPVHSRRGRTATVTKRKVRQSPPSFIIVAIFS